MLNELHKVEQERPLGQQKTLLIHKSVCAIQINILLANMSTMYRSHTAENVSALDLTFESHSRSSLIVETPHMLIVTYGLTQLTLIPDFKI